MNIELNCNVRALRRPATDSNGRKRANVPARIKIGPARADCTVTDMSASGACLSYDGPLDESLELWVIIDRFPPIAATTAWRKNNRIGIRFRQDQDWVQQFHKGRFDPAAWLQNTSVN